MQFGMIALYAETRRDVMKNVCEILKNEIKKAAENSRGIRADINDLKWKPAACKEAQAILSKRRQDKQPSIGKKALKPFLRPETGSARDELWSLKRDEGRKARHLMLAYGALRGRSYARIEGKCREYNQPNEFKIAKIIQELDPALSVMWTKERIRAWFKGESLPERMGAAA